MGAHLLGSLKTVLGENAHVGDIRGKGLMIGIELVDNKDKKTPVSGSKAFSYVLQASTLGLLIYYHGSFVGIFPPLIIDNTVADEIVTILDETFNGKGGAKVARTLKVAKDLAQVKFGKRS